MNQAFYLTETRNIDVIENSHWKLKIETRHAKKYRNLQ